MELIIRKETPADFKEVFKVIKEAFKTAEYSDYNEHFLVDKLRNSDAFIPDLSIVALSHGEIIGHILLTKLKIKNKDQVFESLALAPVSVKPAYQKKGIGAKLIKEAHSIAKSLGFKSIILLGHAAYYPRFGYELTSKFGIKLPFDAPEENCMVIELVENGLKGVSGTVEYPKEFFE